MKKVSYFSPSFCETSKVIFHIIRFRLVKVVVKKKWTEKKNNKKRYCEKSSRFTFFLGNCLWTGWDQVWIFTVNICTHSWRSGSQQVNVCSFETSRWRLNFRNVKYQSRVFLLQPMTTSPKQSAAISHVTVSSASYSNTNFIKLWFGVSGMWYDYVRKFSFNRPTSTTTTLAWYLTLKPKVRQSLYTFVGILNSL